MCTPERDEPCGESYMKAALPAPPISGQIAWRRFILREFVAFHGHDLPQPMLAQGFERLATST